MAVEWTKEMFDSAYELNAEPMGHQNTRKAITLHYHRYVMYPIMLKRAQRLVDVLGLTLDDNILIVGAGFGWTVEALFGMGYNVVGTDTSPYIHSSRDLSEDEDLSAAISRAGLDSSNGEGMVIFNRLKGDGTRARGKVLNEDSASNRSRNAVIRELGTPTVIITEDLVISLSDAENAQLQSFITQYGVDARVVHFVSIYYSDSDEVPIQGPEWMNIKTLLEWKTLFPTSSIVGDGTFEVV